MNSQKTNLQAFMTSLAVKWLVIANVCVFPIGLVLSSGGPIPDYTSIGFVPLVFAHQLSGGNLLDAAVSLLRYQFLHFDFTHLLMNMMFLVAAGLSLETVLGYRRVLSLYLASGVVAAITYAMLFPGLILPLIGASGAVAGLMGASLVLTAEQPLFGFGSYVVTVRVLFSIWFLDQVYMLVKALGSPIAGQMVVHIAGLMTGYAIATYWKRSMVVQSDSKSDSGSV